MPALYPIYAARMLQCVRNHGHVAHKQRATTRLHGMRVCSTTTCCNDVPFYCCALESSRNRFWAHTIPRNTHSHSVCNPMKELPIHRTPPQPTNQK